MGDNRLVLGDELQKSLEIKSFSKVGNSLNFILGNIDKKLLILANPQYKREMLKKRMENTKEAKDNRIRKERLKKPRFFKSEDDGKYRETEEDEMRDILYGDVHETEKTSSQEQELIGRLDPKPYVFSTISRKKREEQFKPKSTNPVVGQYRPKFNWIDKNLVNHKIGTVPRITTAWANTPRNMTENMSEEFRTFSSPKSGMPGMYRNFQTNGNNRPTTVGYGKLRVSTRPGTTKNIKNVKKEGKQGERDKQRNPSLGTENLTRPTESLEGTGMQVDNWNSLGGFMVQGRSIDRNSPSLQHVPSCCFDKTTSRDKHFFHYGTKKYNKATEGFCPVNFPSYYSKYKKSLSYVNLEKQLPRQKLFTIKYLPDYDPNFDSIRPKTAKMAIQDEFKDRKIPHLFQELKRTLPV